MKIPLVFPYLRNKHTHTHTHARTTNPHTSRWKQEDTLSPLHFTLPTRPTFPLFGAHFEERSLIGKTIWTHTHTHTHTHIQNTHMHTRTGPVCTGKKLWDVLTRTNNNNKFRKKRRRRRRDWFQRRREGGGVLWKSPNSRRGCLLDCNFFAF